MAETTTGRIRRRESPLPGLQGLEAIRATSKYRRVAALVPAPPTPTIPPGPHGDLGHASVDELVKLIGEVWPASATTVGNRRRGVRHFLGELMMLPGETWQERWDASDLAAGTRHLGRKGTDQIAAYRTSVGMKLMFCLRVVRPTLPAFRAHTIHHYAGQFRIAQADPQLDRFYEHVHAVEAGYNRNLWIEVGVRSVAYPPV